MAERQAGSPADALRNWLESRDESSQEACLLAYLPLVRRAWHRIQVSLPPSARDLGADLLQCGALGLLQAIRTWVPEGGAPFEAWAALKIRGAMLDELRRQDLLGKETRRRWKQLQKASAELDQQLHRHGSEEELAAHLGVGVEELRQRLLQNAPAALVFLDGLAPEGSLPLRERIADTAAPAPDAESQRREILAALERAVEALPQQERNLLWLLLDQELSHKEAAAAMGLSPGRISQIYAKAILHLQNALAPSFNP